jgi:hypothetical protein
VRWSRHLDLSGNLYKNKDHGPSKYRVREKLNAYPKSYPNTSITSIFRYKYSGC